MLEDGTGFSTRCVHAAAYKDAHRSVVVPIYQTSTFAFENTDQGMRIFKGEEEGYKYTRLGNPTTRAAELRLANLEGSEDCLLFGSGMGAIHATLFALLEAGDHIIADDTLYGATFALLNSGFKRFGVEVTFVDTSKPGEVERALRPSTKIVFIETPANPTIKIVDIARVVQEAKASLAPPSKSSVPAANECQCTECRCRSQCADSLPKSASASLPGSHSNCQCGALPASRSGKLRETTLSRVLVVVDNTFAGPCLTNPLTLGADIVLHSATKSLGGHSDLLAGAVCSTGDLVTRILRSGLSVTGAVLSPHDAFLLLRGLQTLDLRVNRACESAVKVADFLFGHPAVQKVNFPGLKDFPGHEVAARQMRAFGSMLSFEVRGGIESASTVLNSCRVFTQAVSLGGCESLISNPATTTHACIPKQERERAGIDDGLIRASIGIEACADLLADLKSGLDLVKERLHL
jgi:methionine-gamma-lyase